MMTIPRSTLPFLVILIFSSCTNAWTTLPPFGITVCDVRNAATILAVTLTLGSAVLSDISSQPNNIQQGAHVFDTTCASCHFQGGNKIDPKKTLSKQDLETYIVMDPSDVQLYLKTDFLHRGANLFGGELTEKELENVVAFVLNQSNENKW